MKETVERKIVQSILSTVLVAAARLACALFDLVLNALELGVEGSEPLGGVRLGDARRLCAPGARLRLGGERRQPLLGGSLPGEQALTVGGREPALAELQRFGATSRIDLRGGAGVRPFTFARFGGGELRSAYRFGEGFALSVARSLA